MSPHDRIRTPASRNPRENSFTLKASNSFLRSYILIVFHISMMLTALLSDGKVRKYPSPRLNTRSLEKCGFALRTIFGYVVIALPLSAGFKLKKSPALRSRSLPTSVELMVAGLNSTSERIHKFQWSLPISSASTCFGI